MLSVTLTRGRPTSAWTLFLRRRASVIARRMATSQRLSTLKVIKREQFGHCIWCPSFISVTFARNGNTQRGQRTFSLPSIYYLRKVGENSSNIRTVFAPPRLKKPAPIPVAVNKNGMIVVQFGSHERRVFCAGLSLRTAVPGVSAKRFPFVRPTTCSGYTQQLDKAEWLESLKMMVKETSQVASSPNTRTDDWRPFM